MIKQVQFFGKDEFIDFIHNPPTPIYIIATGSSELCYWVEYELQSEHGEKEVN